MTELWLTIAAPLQDLGAGRAIRPPDLDPSLSRLRQPPELSLLEPLLWVLVPLSWLVELLLVWLGVGGSSTGRPPRCS